ncbi:Protein N-acetyltransferase, RimJ/RimL family [Deinococcus reticulitermitis]|uniref:Protein N-acetyltransferase, RimJ/RimL family n=1 Tax=Deinococcus reticulitermitis TaxID=856736 RepID=A0A1H7C0L2_9DEIO|nr:GNAT family protein [Deinococcus reticulitermitis]SEJ82804.1 Protein N-acetyltransferase, RimJ/RimL family [Deinococcus reticulitermitis]
MDFLAVSPSELLRWQAAALYTFDSRGRMVGVNEPGFTAAEREPAPRFFLGRSEGGNVWRVRHDVPDDLAADLEALARTEPASVPKGELPQSAEAVRDALSRSAPLTSKWRGPAYWLPELGLPIPEHAVQLNAENQRLAEVHFPALLGRPWGSRVGPVTAAVVGGQAVALCTCARFTARVAEAGVRTAEAYRGQGHALAAVTLWAALVRASGRVPLYSTSWDNLASQRVAARLGPPSTPKTGPSLDLPPDP